MGQHKRTPGPLEHLFGSRTRAKLLRLLLLHPDQAYYTRELARRIGEQLNSVRRELANLEKLGLTAGESRGNKRFFGIARQHLLVPELTALFQKAQVIVDSSVLKRLAASGRIRYLALTGQFMGLSGQTMTDVLIVGSCNRAKLRRVLRELQRDLDKPITYTVMTPNEFKYRNQLTDRFLYTVLENRKIVLVDKLPITSGPLALR